MRNIIHRPNIPVSKTMGTVLILVTALLLSAGCGMSQPGPSTPFHLDASQEAIEKCRIEAASRWQANFQESRKAYGRLGQESGNLFASADGSSADNAAQLGEAAGKVFGTIMGMFERNSFQEKAIRDCLAARSGEMSG